MADYKSQLAAIGYKYNNSGLEATGYNKINGISFTAHMSVSDKVITIEADAVPNGEADVVELQKYLDQFAADRKNIVNTASFNNNVISIAYRLNSPSKAGEYVKEATDAILFFCNQCNCHPVCRVCGKAVNTDFYAVKGQVHPLCPDCFHNLQNTIMSEAQEESNKVTNFPLGIVGAILGGLIGAVLWVIFSMLGRVVVLAGLVSGLAGVFGFKLLGKKLTLAGLITSVIISLAMLLLGMYFALGIDVYNAFKSSGISFSDAFKIIPEILQDKKNLGAAIRDSSFGIVGFIVTAVFSFIQFFNERKIKNQAVRLD